MADKVKRCFICGTEYSYCPHCKDARPEEAWKILFHDEKCRDISRIWYAYRGKEISKAEAKELMSAFKPNIDDALKYDSIPAKEIQEIFGIVKAEDPHDEETVVNEAENKSESIDEVDVNVSDDVDVKDKVVNEKHNYESGNNKNKYNNKKH